jgi:predicted MPP superfamily phosphohydrolase
MHLYAFLRLRYTFQLKGLVASLLFLLMTVMIFLPFIVRVAEQAGMANTALISAWFAYLWMGLIFIFTSALFFTDIVCILFNFILRPFYRQSQNVFSLSKGCKLALYISVFISIYSFIEASQIRSEHVVIYSSKLPPLINKVRIVQISDVHIGLLLQEWRLVRILEKVRAANPDILVSTGDLIDGKLNRDNAISELNPLASLIKSVSAPLGKFAVVGNHEVYAGLPQSLAFSRAAGFTMLRNQSQFLNNGITITGVDDPVADAMSINTQESEASILNLVPITSFSLLLKHRPEIIPKSDGHFDLQLSGHVHGGQIFPFNFFVKLVHPIPCGISTTKAGSNIYVSRGTGTWGPPMRLLVPPEVTIIDIIYKADPKQTGSKS